MTIGWGLAPRGRVLRSITFWCTGKCGHGKARIQTANRASRFIYCAFCRKTQRFEAR